MVVAIEIPIIFSIYYFGISHENEHAKDSFRVPDRCEVPSLILRGGISPPSKSLKKHLESLYMHIDFGA